MENQRLIHDCALMMAEHCIEMLGSLLTDEDKIDAREEFYHVCKAGIEAFCVQQDRLRHRLHPTRN